LFLDKKPTSSILIEVNLLLNKELSVTPILSPHMPSRKLRIRIPNSLLLVACIMLASLPRIALAQLNRGEIVELQKQAVDEGWTFEVAENDATKYSLDQLCGLKEPDDWRARARFDQIATSSSTAVLPTAFDWRTYNGCTPIRNQGGCGSCWAFATVGALECAIRVREAQSVDLSEQWLLSCNHEGWDCDGGWYAHAYHEWATDPCNSSGAVLESSFPYVAWERMCACPYEHKYWIDSWAYIDGGIEAMKRAILEYGPISISVYVNSAFQSYHGGIFNACATGTVNHSVVLVGWDDAQGTNGIWIMRNSWGAGWGESGYMRIPYGCSLVGYAACYVDYRPVHVISQNDFGTVPLTAQFQSEVPGEIVTAYAWDLGDGAVSNDPAPTHVYDVPGCYTVKLTATTPSGDLHKMIPNLVTAHADTLRGAGVEISSGGPVRMDVSARNFVPVQKLTIPFTWAGSLNLRYDSLSVAGARTEYFDAVTTVGLDLVNKVSTVVLRAGNQPPLPAGDGTILSLWFTANATSTGINEIAFITDGPYSPTFESGENIYGPTLVPGYFTRGLAIGCCEGRVGDVDRIGGDEPTLGDVMIMVDHLFVTGNLLGCVEEADINQSGGATPTYSDLTLGDIMVLVDYLFISGTPLLDCF
jgi:C1A family cysteine protease/PKD repeat protein